LRKSMILGMGLCLGLAACGSDPMKASNELLKKGDLSGAVSALQQLEAKKPELKDVHYELFLAYRLQASQAGAKADELTRSAIDEFTWICKSEGIGADYQHMEETLQGADKSKAAFAAAYALIYPH
jgi:hypothetical protein